MSECTPDGNQTTVTTERSTGNPTEAFVEFVTTALEQCDAPDETVASVETHGSRMAEHVQQVESRNEQLSEHVQQLESELAEEQERSARERADVRSDVHDLKEAVEPDDGDGVDPISDGPTPTGDGDGTNQQTQAPKTALGDCITLPETVADQELTANIKRARDVAADIVDYGRSVPAGYAITSSELRTVLTAIKDDDGRTYTETVGRVIEYLEDLGGDDVVVKQTMGGQRTVIFDDEFVRRTVAWRNQSVGNDVVTDGRARG
jgi:hypothetical protein